MSRFRTSNLTDSCFSFSVGGGGVIVDLEVPQLKVFVVENKNIRAQNCSTNTGKNVLLNLKAYLDPFRL